MEKRKQLQQILLWDFYSSTSVPKSFSNPDLQLRQGTANLGAVTPTICISYFSVVDIKHHGRKQLIEEFLLTDSPRGIRVHHDRQLA